MRALTLQPCWAALVYLGEKTVECRSWATDYRGPLLVCAGARRQGGCVCGHAVAVADLSDVRRFTDADLYDACMEPGEAPDGSWAWVLSDVRLIEPVPVRGRQGLFDAPVEPRVLCGVGDDAARDALRESFLPLVRFGRGDEDMRETWRDLCGLDALPA